MRPWGNATIKTLLARLKHKKAVRSQRETGVLRYRPLIDHDAYVDDQVRALVDRLFAGDASALIALLTALQKPA